MDHLGQRQKNPSINRKVDGGSHLRNQLKQRIARLRENFQKLQDGKLKPQMRVDVQVCLSALDMFEDIDRQAASVRKEVKEAITRLYIRYDQMRLENRQRKMSVKETKAFWDEERGDR